MDTSCRHCLMPAGESLSPRNPAAGCLPVSWKINPGWAMSLQPVLLLPSLWQYPALPGGAGSSLGRPQPPSHSISFNLIQSNLMID